MSNYVPFTDEEKAIFEESRLQFLGMMPPSWPRYAAESAAFHLASWSVRLECCDNRRWARVSNPIELAEYVRKRSKGCCGFRDEVFFEEDEPFLVGCNYGH